MKKQKNKVIELKLPDGKVGMDHKGRIVSLPGGIEHTEGESSNILVSAADLDRVARDYAHLAKPLAELHKARAALETLDAERAKLAAIRDDAQSEVDTLRDQSIDQIGGSGNAAIYAICFRTDGRIGFGCQCVDAVTFHKAHKLSLKLRGKSKA